MVSWKPLDVHRGNCRSWFFAASNDLSSEWDPCDFRGKGA